MCGGLGKPFGYRCGWKTWFWPFFIFYFCLYSLNVIKKRSIYYTETTCKCFYLFSLNKKNLSSCKYYIEKGVKGFKKHRVTVIVNSDFLTLWMPCFNQDAGKQNKPKRIQFNFYSGPSCQWIHNDERSSLFWWWWYDSSTQIFKIFKLLLFF